MKEKNEKEEIAPREEKVTVLTPFGFMRRFTTDMERLFEEFRFPNLYGREFFPFTREFEHVGWVPEIEVLRKNGEFIVRPRLRSEFANGHTYYALAGQKLRPPKVADAAPDPELLAWHSETVFQAA